MVIRLMSRPPQERSLSQMKSFVRTKFAVSVDEELQRK